MTETHVPVKENLFWTNESLGTEKKDTVRPVPAWCCFRWATVTMYFYTRGTHTPFLGCEGDTDLS